MIFLTGETTGKTVPLIESMGWGRMFVVKKPSPYNNENWGFDNGAFVWYKKGVPFDQVKYKERLEYAYSIGEPYVAVVPDIVGQGKASLKFSLGWLKHLPSDWPWYLALQDGMTKEDVTPHLHKFEGLFLGGTDDFKSTAIEWSNLAHKNGKKFHYGRAGTKRKILHAFMVNSDSADSAFPLWSFDRLKETDEFIKRCNELKG